MKLTPAQRHVLLNIETLVGHFDVWAGYWWTLGESRIQKATVDALTRSELISEGPYRRPHSGRRETPYRLTTAGRAALAEKGGDG